MHARFLFGMKTAAVLAAAFSLSACDRSAPGGETTARRPETSTAAPQETTEKIAAAVDKLATALDDGTLTAKVKTALLSEPGLRSLQIEVETKNSTVTLSGSVDSAASRARAKEVAASVDGVRGVVDRMTVKS